MARDAIDTLSEALDVRIPADLRKPLLDLVQNLVDNGRRGADLEHLETVNGLNDTLRDTSVSFVAALDDAAMRDAFANKVRGQEPSVWVKTLLDLKTPGIEAAARQSYTDALAALLPEGASRDGYTSKVKAMSDTKQLAQAFHDALVGVVGPGGEPRVAARGGAGPVDLAEVTRRRAAGEYKSDEEFLEAQNVALGKT